MNMQQALSRDREYVLVVYDVPTKSGAVRPPALMHRLGARINLSCWLLPLCNLKRVPVGEWQAGGATVCVSPPFDTALPENREKLLDMARMGLRNEMKAIRERLRKACYGAAHCYAIAKGNLADEKALKTADTRAYWAMRRARLSLVAAQEASLAFDLSGDFDEAFEAIRSAIQSESESLAASRRVVMLTKAERDARAAIAAEVK